MWNNLKASIAAVIRTNNNQEITGANLQGILNTIVNSVGANATFAGIATPSTNPGTPDGPVFYIAYEPGTYSNFNITTVDGLYILENKTGSWVGTRISTAGGTSGTTFTPHVDSDGNLSWTNDGGKPNPETVNIKGPQGDTVVLGDGTTYKLYNSTGQNTDGAMTQKAVTDKIAEIAEGQGTLVLDDAPTAGSNNPVKSNGIKVALDAKQDKLTFDNVPIANSNNPVKSSGIKVVLDAKQDTINTVNVEVDNNTGTPSGTASVNGSTLLLSFQNLKGATGAQGPQGPQGPQGERGLPGPSGVTGDVSGFTVHQDIDPYGDYYGTDIAGAAAVQATNAELTELEEDVHAIEEDIDLNNQEGSFNIVDENGNIAFRVDNDGVKARLYNICDENGTIVGQMKIKNNLGAFRIVDDNSNIGFEVDSNGAKSRLYNICDEDGNVIAKIDGNTSVFRIVDGNYDTGFQIDSDGVKARHYNICDADGNIIYTINENSIDNIISLDTDKTIQQKSTTPLSVIKESMGFMPMFPNFGFIGDSLTSGFLAVPNVNDESPVTNRNIYHSSWGQIICRFCGIDGTNFSVGGTTARSWLDNYPNNANADGYNTLRGNAGVDFSNDKKSAYTICLGANDSARSVPIGNVSTDVDVNNYANNNQNTFAGQYATIISKCKELCPSAKIFLITPFRWWASAAETRGYNDIVRQLAELFPKTYLIDLALYGINQNYSIYELSAHCTAMGNVYVAYLIANAIELIIRQNPNDFEMHTAIEHLKDGFDNGNY